MTLPHSRILIVGGTKGVGRATARKIAAAGRSPIPAGPAGERIVQNLRERSAPDRRGPPDAAS